MRVACSGNRHPLHVGKHAMSQDQQILANDDRFCIVSEHKTTL